MLTKNLMPTEPTNLLINAVLFISQYETDELNVSFNATKKLVNLFNTSVAFAGGNEDADILKEPKILERELNKSILFEQKKQQI